MEAWMTPTASARGIRNNNPCNLRANSRWTWIGQKAADSSGFCIFDSPVNGLRAALINFEHMQEFHGCHTVAEVITRQAPPNENATSDYIQYVADWLGVSPNDPISISTRYNEFLKAVVTYENGSQPYSNDTLYAAWLAASTR